MKSSRFFYIILMFAAAGLGIASRLKAGWFPGVVQPHLGDASWALAAYAVVGIIFPRCKVPVKLLIAFGVCAVVELSQLSEAGWLEAIRDSQAGRWLLGTGFLWMDFVRYAAGLAAGALLDSAFTEKRI